MSLNLTSNLVYIYIITSIADDTKVEIRFTVALLDSDLYSIPALFNTDAYLQTLDACIKDDFMSVAPNIEVVDVQCTDSKCTDYESEDSSDGQRHQIFINLSSNLLSFIICVVCFIVLCAIIAGVCYRYPALSYCCCCLPIKYRRCMRDYCRANVSTDDDVCCYCSYFQRFNFGLFDDDEIAHLLKQRQERINDIFEEKEEYITDDDGCNVLLNDLISNDAGFEDDEYVANENQAKLKRKKNKKGGEIEMEDIFNLNTNVNEMSSSANRLFHEKKRYTIQEDIEIEHY